jgi:hypothetical protein
LRTKRVFFGVIALYAVSLERAAVCALPAPAASSGVITCLQNKRSPSTPANDFHRHHGACCMLACAASCFAGAVPAGGVPASPALLVSFVVFARAREADAQEPLKFYFAARGPPSMAREIGG